MLCFVRQSKKDAVCNALNKNDAQCKKIVDKTHGATYNTINE